MSNKKTERELLEENEALRAELLEKNKKLQEQNVAIKAAQKSGKISPVVSGEFTATWKDLNGEEQSKKVAFINGTTQIRIPKLEGIQAPVGIAIPSEALFKIANGKEVAEDVIQAHPALKNLDKEQAGNILTHFARIKAAFVK